MKQSLFTRRQFVETSLLGAGCLAVAGASTESWAGSAPPDLTASLIAVWAKAKEYTLEFARAMPEDAYGFKPTEEVRSFAEQILHIAGANFFFVSAIKGEEKSPKSQDELKAEGKTKAEIIKLLSDSFEYGDDVINSLTKEQAMEEIAFGKRKLIKWKAVLFVSDHTTHHRGQTVIYLRMKGIKPPQYRSGFLG